MNGWMALDDMARPRGDGLAPAMRELMLRHAGAANVVDLAQRRGDPTVQAGPTPRPDVPAHLPHNVVRFPNRPS